MLDVGTKAPEFSLPDQHRNPVSLDDIKGSKALVVFIPFPFTSTCEGELCMIRDNMAQLNDLDANVVVISCDTLPANRKWAELNGFEFPILSDFWPHGDVARAYGAFNENVGAANRVTYILDSEGVIHTSVATDSLGVAREFELYTEALASLS